MTTYNFGTVADNSTLVKDFTFDKQVKSVSCGCGCSTPTININKITISVNTGSFPAIMTKQGKDTYNSTKTCTVHFTDSTEERINLSFTLKSK